MTLLGLFAHSFGRVYNLPVPFWLYAWGSAAALALSFVVVAWFATQPARDVAAARLIAFQPPRALSVLARALGVAALALCIATALFGARNPYANFSMTAFWVVFALGLTYLCALLGDVYASINPWAILSRGEGVVAYPAWLGYWPALALYMAFIWLELFGGGKPGSLAIALVAYTLLNVGGCWLVGRAAWFRYCEFFSVFFRLIARMAPIERSSRGLRLRWPFTGVLDEPAEHVSLAIFALFMLSSTAFDGLHATVPWAEFSWRDVVSRATPLLGPVRSGSYPLMHALYQGWQTAALVLSPFVYFAIYLAFIALTRIAAGSDRPVRELALRFSLTLLPIALVYHVTHYYTLLVTQGLQIVPLVSDPFGRGWNLFGTRELFRELIIPDAAVVWHTQVVLIVVGHIAAVYLAHVEALRVFGDRRRAALSQLPMLVLMMLFTTFGLWILAQPIRGAA